MTGASGFVSSDEFIKMYGASPTNRAIVEKIYMNVLDRPGELAGIEFWTGVLDQNRSTVADVLAGFSESPENVAALTGVMTKGIPYLPFG